MLMADLNTVRLHWKEDGDPDGLPIVFANSLGTDLRLWDKIVSRLPKGLRIIRFDKRGHGLSSCPPAPYSIADLTDDTDALLDYLEVSTCVFVGLSIGGMMGQSLAAQRPQRIKALVLSNTATKMGEAQMWQDRISAIRMSGIESLADAILNRWFAMDFLATAEAEAWRNMLIRTPVEGYIGCCAAIAGTDLSETTSTLRVPVLGIGGREDGASPSELVRATTQLVPDSRFVEIENAGHLPCVEQPEAFAGHLTAFLKEKCL